MGKSSTSFKQGNEFWKRRSSFGEKAVFKHPDEMRKACYEYFEWVEENPLYEWKAWMYQGDVIRKPIPKMRAMTIRGMCIFLGFTTKTWHEYANKAEYSVISKEIADVIKTQKFEGASADLLNASIIARDLGLVDKSKSDVTVNGGVITVPLASNNKEWEQIAGQSQEQLKTDVRT